MLRILGAALLAVAFCCLASVSMIHVRRSLRTGVATLQGWPTAKRVRRPFLYWLYVGIQTWPFTLATLVLVRLL